MVTFAMFIIGGGWFINPEKQYFIMGKRAGICSICGGLAEPAYTCMLCGAIVCSKCFLPEKGVCRKCAAKLGK